ncbi:hypothetical protein [Opitutus terrae]|uniref:Uncharacterized protein n=1 Tax=Opitutus terrae (strain DSM 11246 / JCM 15787 / PB90-1) TaxID=452637 RepID=B1ZSF6_OPITP|nr:hypothetical protein [Opitutus terrae]ACB73813.1 hypothetical protein Oter_0523 [Opitutus terrae PB90-1]
MPLAPANRARLQASLAVVGLAVLCWRVPGVVTTVLLMLGATLALVAWISPRAYAPVQRGFDALLHGLLVVLTWTSLALVYFGLFTPVRVWRLLTHNDPLGLRSQQGSAPTTYLQPLPPTPARFDRQF